MGKHITSVKFINLTSYKERYKKLILNLKKNCLSNEPKIVAFSFSMGFCVGIIPFIGFTFITITALGALFKLNQLIIQITHLLVSPLQIVLLPIFLKAGQLIFHQPNYNLGTLINECIHSKILIVIQHFGNIIFYGLIVWLGFSICVGLILYHLLLFLLKPKAKAPHLSFE